MSRRRPGRRRRPPSEGNAFLSAAGNVSRFGSTVPPANLTACTMIFKGATNNALTIYARAPVAPTTGCNNPATNTGGSATVLFTGGLTHQPAASPYDWTLNVPNTHTSNPPWTTSTRPSRVERPSGRGAPLGYPHRMLGTWDYTAAGDAANDTHVSSDPCP